MLTRDVAITTAKNFIADLISIGYNPTQAYIFGSVVNNNTHKYSDIDLAVWDKNFTGILHLDIEKIKYILLKYKYIELHSFAENTDEQNNPFVKIIKDMGIALITSK
ncbi:MAG: nucleotidyltransferase domain-containing protein [Bacteroidia bacterium]|nr:nucleotidyltransferase domain-containing protein [Bacteroidia bacterium]